MFFVGMLISTVTTTKLNDRRNSWHCGWWPVKVALIIGCFFFSQVVPSGWIETYGKVAQVGAGVFLVLQLMSTIRFITQLNYKLCETNFEERYIRVIAISGTAILTFLGLIVFLSLKFVQCWHNMELIVITMVLFFIMCGVSLMSKFFVSGLLGTVYSAFTMGTGYKCTRNTLESEDNKPYGYGFFHFIFMSGCMYFGMMFVAWDTHHTMEEWNVDIGWISTWIHIASEALVVVSYLTILLARILGVDWLQHFLAKIFGTDDQLHGDESHTTIVHGDESETTTVHGDEFETTTVHGDESETRTVHGDESETTTVHGDESETTNTHVTSSSSLYHTASPSSLYYSPEQSPPNNTDHQPPPPPPSSSSPHTIELQMFEIPNIGTSGMNEEEDDDDHIREWESE
ncbi:hypothetical protein Zm00014a_035649 [Zea mays]|uniref:Serinc-domain containing serine and sphingolipid biosynthesis protein n=1 Tax=Zea mays TaxID=4577 RepID=A0A3L6E5B7_MAIZE|nr:hypothetical protein Zm00014a_035649 [Zea mays]